jgi:hypothetical protein
MPAERTVRRVGAALRTSITDEMRPATVHSHQIIIRFTQFGPDSKF